MLPSWLHRLTETAKPPMRVLRPTIGILGRIGYAGHTGMKASVNGISLIRKMESTREHSTAIKGVKASSWANFTSPGAAGGKHPEESNGSQTSKAYIALGSNLGDRVGWIDQACNEMTSRGINVLRTSSLWETEPMYVLDQNNFLNGVCEVGRPL